MLRLEYQAMTGAGLSTYTSTSKPNSSCLEWLVRLFKCLCCWCRSSCDDTIDAQSPLPAHQQPTAQKAVTVYNSSLTPAQHAEIDRVAEERIACFRLKPGTRIEYQDKALIVEAGALHGKSCMIEITHHIEITDPNARHLLGRRIWIQEGEDVNQVVSRQLQGLKAGDRGREYIIGAAAYSDLDYFQWGSKMKIYAYPIAPIVNFTKDRPL